MFLVLPPFGSAAVFHLKCSGLDLVSIKVLQYTMVFTNPAGMIFNTVKITDTPLSTKII